MNYIIAASLLILCALAAGNAQSVPVSICIEAEHFHDTSRVKVSASGSRLTGCTTQSWVLFRDIDFMQGAFDSVTVYTATGWKYHNPDFSYTAHVEFRTGSHTGPVVARAQIGRYDNNAGKAWKGAFLTKVTGVHDVYVTFSAQRDTVCTFDRFVFAGAAAYSAADVHDYYVSTNGSDINDGRSLDMPFKTIQKAASVMKPGGRCFIRQGIYRETVRPVFSGLPGAPLTFEAYGNERVFISGADSVKNWTNHSGNIYKATLPWNIGKYKTQIIVNGNMAWNARYPNVDESYIPHPWLLWCGDGFGISDRRRWQTLAEPIATPQRVCLYGNGTAGYGQVGSSYNFSINQSSDARYQLPSEVFNRVADFFKDGLITTQSSYWMGSGLITSSTSTATRTEINAGRINPKSPHNTGGPGWISHVFGLLDAPNEWYLDSSSHTLYLWPPGNGNPSNMLVEAKRRVLGFDLTTKQYVVVRKLGFIATSMTLKDAQNCRIEECQFTYVTHDDVPSEYEMGVNFEIDQNLGDGHLGIFLGGSNNVMSKCAVRGSAHSGIIIGGKYCMVSNCHITSCDYSITYHAGVLVMIDGPDWTESKQVVGAVVCSSYFAYNNRASIQVGHHLTSQNKNDRIRIHNNIFGTSGYTNETGQVAAQSCKYGEVTNNIFHDAAFMTVGSVVTENDRGAKGWIIHHNVFYQGDSSVVMTAKDGTVQRRCCDWTPDDEAMVFNNTVVDSSAPGHLNWEYMRDFNPDGTLSNNSWPMDRGNIIWPGDTAYWKFNDPGNRDYSLRPGSPAIDAGVIVPGWVEDFEGTAPDLGAFEYGRTPWTAGPTWTEESWAYPPGAFSARRTICAFSRDRAPSIHVLRKGGTLVLRGVPGVDRIVVVCDARGQIIHRVQWSARSGEIALDSKRWANRIYMIKVTTGTGSVMKKVCGIR